LTFADKREGAFRPDGSLRAKSSTSTHQKQPLLIIEVANTQKDLETNVILKSEEYVEGAHGRISVIVILKIGPNLNAQHDYGSGKLNAIVVPRRSSVRASLLRINHSSKSLSFTPISNAPI